MEAVNGAGGASPFDDDYRNGTNLRGNRVRQLIIIAPPGLIGPLYRRASCVDVECQLTIIDGEAQTSAGLRREWPDIKSNSIGFLPDDQL